jgi:hypothetical protein
MARIIDIVRAKKAAIAGNHPAAEDIGGLAVAAILNGINTPQWRAYMQSFPGLSAQQLQRLNGEDGTLGDKTLDKKRAYMAANAMCGMQSPDTQNLDFRVNSIDQNLPEGPCDPEP